ncbi:hypothetical protein Bca101_043355 [Brassica carinata]
MHDYEEDLEEEAGYDGYYSDDGGSENEELPPKETRCGVLNMGMIFFDQAAESGILPRTPAARKPVRRLEAEDSARNLETSVKDSEATDLQVVTSGPMGDPIV